VNVLWGLLNLAIGYLLVCRVGKFELRNTKVSCIQGVCIRTYTASGEDTFTPASVAYLHQMVVVQSCTL
jgi:hypothetical protein